MPVQRLGKTAIITPAARAVPKTENSGVANVGPAIATTMTLEIWWKCSHTLRVRDGLALNLNR